MGKRFSGLKIGLVVACSLALVFTSIGTASAWVPDRPVEFIVPGGAGGGADIMARFIAPLVSKYKLSPKPWVVINKSAGAGAEGFMYVKGSKGNANLIIITLDNLFTTPLATGVPFNWKDMTPVARLALDEFVLWVNAASPYKTAMEYIDAVKKEPGKFVMGGTGAKQEDQIITVELEQAFGLKFNYVPFKGGGTVAVELVGKHINSSVNNPAEAVSHWKNGTLRPLAIFDAQTARPAGLEGHPHDERGHRQGHRLSDAARNLHGARCHQGTAGILCRYVEEGDGNQGMEKVHHGQRAEGRLPGGA